MLLIDFDDVKKAADMKTILKAVKNVFLEVSKGSVIAPTRSQINIDKHNGTIFVMPSYIGGTDVFAIKIVASHPDNPQKFELPTIMGYIMLIDSKNGEAIALMDGNYLTALRTGAVSGVATKYLSREGSSNIGIIGAGVQARTQILSIIEILDDIEEIRVFDKKRKSSLDFVADLSSEIDINIVAVNSSREAVESMDIVIEATTSISPVFNGDWLKEGAHINSVGWMGPSSRQLDDSTVKRSRIVVDTLEGALTESGDMIIPIAEGTISRNSVRIELSDIVSGSVEGRVDDKEITLFKAVGFSPADAAAAKAVFDNAVEKGIGKTVKLN